MKPAAALVLALLALAAGAAAGRFLLAPAPSGPESLDARLEREIVRSGELQQQVDRLEAAAKARAAQDAARLAAAPPPPAPAVPRASPPTPEVVPSDPAAGTAGKAARYEVAGFEDLVRSVDWAKVGANLQTMAPLLGEFGQEWAKTGKVPMALAMKIQEMNAPLVTAAVTAAEKLKMEASRANSAFTHPVFQANAIAAAMEAGGKPLSEAQGEALGRLAEQFGAEDARRLQGYDERTYALQKSLDESLLRERFFEAVRALLTDEQRALLGSPQAQGRTQMDLFSAGLAWAARMQVLPYVARDGLATGMERQVFQHFELKDEHLPAVKQVVARWADALPAEWFQEPHDPLSSLGMVPVARVHEAARRELALLDDLIRSVGFDAEGAAKVRATDFVLVPVRSK